MDAIACQIRTMDSDLSEKFIVSACEDSLVRLFTVKNNNMELLAQLSGHKGIVTQALFIHHGELIASSDFEGKLIIWKLENSNFVKKTELQVTKGPIYDIAARYSENGSITVFCGCDNGKLKTVVFDSNLKSTVKEEDIHRYGVISVDCNAEYTVTGGTDCSVGLIRDGEIEHFKHHSGSVNAVAIAPNSQEQRVLFASASEDGTLVFIKKDLQNVKKQEINIGEPCYDLDWNRTGFVLTVGYGEGNFKSFIMGENETFEEIPMEKIQKEDETQ